MRAHAHAGNILTALALIGVLPLIAGCGGDDKGPSSRPTLGTTQFGVMTRELTEASPQGQVSPAQAAAGAKRQADIARRYARTVGAGACKSSLTELAAAYDAFEQAAGKAGASSAEDAAYSAAAGTVSSALQTAEARCV